MVSSKHKISEKNKLGIWNYFTRILILIPAATLIISWVYFFSYLNSLDIDLSSLPISIEAMFDKALELTQMLSTMLVIVTTILVIILAIAVQIKVDTDKEIIKTPSLSKYILNQIPPLAFKIVLIMLITVSCLFLAYYKGTNDGISRHSSVTGNLIKPVILIYKDNVITRKVLILQTLEKGLLIEEKDSIHFVPWNTIKEIKNLNN